MSVEMLHPKLHRGLWLCRVLFAQQHPNYLILTLHFIAAEYEVDRLIVENIKEQKKETQKVITLINVYFCERLINGQLFSASKNENITTCIHANQCKDTDIDLTQCSTIL